MFFHRNLTTLTMKGVVLHIENKGLVNNRKENEKGIYYKNMFSKFFYLLFIMFFWVYKLLLEKLKLPHWLRGLLEFLPI